MCGRIRQARTLEDYQEYLHWNPYTAPKVDEGLQQNVPPGTRPIALHRLGDGDDQVERLFWGYRPPGYRRAPANNARLSTILRRSGFWRPLLGRRIIIPADGWYEWAGDRHSRQPWFVSPCDGEPVLLAAVTAWRPGREHGPESGFAILTDDSTGGQVDLRGRRPICLTPGDALGWLDYALGIDEALEILATAREADAFHCWPVTPQINDTRYQENDAAAPLSTPDPAAAVDPDAA